MSKLSEDERSHLSTILDNTEGLSSLLKLLEFTVEEIEYDIIKKSGDSLADSPQQLWLLKGRQEGASRVLDKFTREINTLRSKRAKG